MFQMSAEDGNIIKKGQMKWEWCGGLKAPRFSLVWLILMSCGSFIIIIN